MGARELELSIELVGSSGVGKRSIIRRIVENSWSEQAYFLLARTLSKDFKMDSGEKCRITFCALPPQDRVNDDFYIRKDCHFFWIVYDVSDLASFNEAKRYLQEVDRYGPNDATCILVGNKSDDLEDVSIEEAATFASERGIDLFKVSAKSGKRVEVICTHCAKIFLDEEQKRHDLEIQAEQLSSTHEEELSKGKKPSLLKRFKRLGRRKNKIPASGSGSTFSAVSRSLETRGSKHSMELDIEDLSGSGNDSSDDTQSPSEHAKERIDDRLVAETEMEVSQEKSERQQFISLK